MSINQQVSRMRYHKLMTEEQYKRWKNCKADICNFTDGEKLVEDIFKNCVDMYLKEKKKAR